jgi:beta-glucanase (GH16 family)
MTSIARIGVLGLGIACALAAGARNAAAEPQSPRTDTARPGWRLVWHDEFDTAVGPDWVYEVGTGTNGWGNNEDEYYTSRRENVRVEQGMLVVEARRERYEAKEFTSARLKTEGRKAFRYGRVEARMQIPRGEGVWPAFWMLGADIHTAHWPQAGEIDIMENIGREPNQVHATVHGPGYSGGKGVGAAYTLPSGAVADAFHVYAVEWEPEKLSFSIDGTVYKVITPADVTGAWVFNHDFFILLNLAIGGNWPGPANKDTKFPAIMRVDYVRVYEREGK